MNNMHVFIDSRRSYARLGRCLKTVSHAASHIHGSITLVLIVDRVRARLTQLAEDYGAHLLELPSGSRGQRYNTSASAVVADALFFIDPLTELPEDWLSHAEQMLFEQHKDVVALTANGCLAPAWFDLFQMPRRHTLALGVRRMWFERVGGFDPNLDTGAERDLLARLTACHARVLDYSHSDDRQAS